MSEIEKNVTEDNKPNTSNIFDEFEVDDDIKDKLDEFSSKKESIYYIEKFGFFFKYINIILFLIIFILSFYVYIQKSESNLLNNKGYLNSICNLLLGDDINIGYENCSGLTIFKNQTEKKIDFIKKDYFIKIVNLLKKSYEIESIKNSKEAIFIIDKSKNKSDPIKILNEFDIIKNNFVGLDKQKIKCKNIFIKDNILEAKCSSYSTAWYSDIPGFEGEKTINTIQGTSITLASSFINYISKSSKFSIIDKQKVFKIIPYFGDGKYVYKTDFQLKIRYNKTNDLSL